MDSMVKLWVFVFGGCGLFAAGFFIIYPLYAPVLGDIAGIASIFTSLVLITVLGFWYLSDWQEDTP